MDLEARLADLGAHVLVPDVGDLSGAVVARIRTPGRHVVHAPSRRGVLLAAAAVLVIVISVLALPAPRHAVARWLGIGTIEVTRVESLPAGLGDRLTLGRATFVDEALDSTAFDVLLPDTATAPNAAFTGVPSADAVTLVWAPSAELPEVRTTGVGLLLTEVLGSIDEPLIGKSIAAGTTFEAVTVDGHPGYWLGGAPHEFFYRGPNGEPIPDSARLAGNTLIWTVGDVTLRLESGLDRDAAVALAATVSGSSSR
jgi:hypothetical protein